MLDYRVEDTICAVSSAPGIGAIAVVRVSGKNALSIVNSILDREIKREDARKVRLRNVMDGGEVLDECLVVYYPHGSSYTGEEMVEIFCHGSLYIQRRIIEVLVGRGCRVAQPGEFSMRAFMNGKMDLTKAEGIAALIQSMTKSQHQLSMSMFRGSIKTKLHQLREKLLNILTLLELELDFSDQDVEFVSRAQIRQILEDVMGEVRRLIKSFDGGNAIRHGIPVVICGRPNAGKSTLLNAVVGEERAIVTPIPGTTRDTIEDLFQYRGLMFRIIDTAGIRQSHDIVEQIGIKKTMEKIGEALVIIYLYDITEMKEEDVLGDISFVRGLARQDAILIPVANKIDMAPTRDSPHISISAKTGHNIQHLLDTIYNQFMEKFPLNEDVVISDVRHLTALKKAEQVLGEAINDVERNVTAEILSLHIRDVSHHLGEITGEITTEDVLTNIFKNFCIGK